MIPTLQLGQLGLSRPSSVVYLDELAVTPRAAWGLRKLIRGATQCIRVRRSSDSTESDIGFSGDALDVSALLTFCGAGSGYIRTIYDQTGNGEDYYQTVAGAQPRIVNSGSYDGAIKWDGSTSSMAIVTLTTGGQYFGFYLRGLLYTPGSTKVLGEITDNYNNYAQTVSLQVTTTKFYPSMRNGTGSNVRQNEFDIPITSVSGVMSLLLDRATTGTGEIRCYQYGSEMTATPTLTVEQTGNFRSDNWFLGSRNNASNFMQLDLFTHAIYAADSSAYRDQIERILAIG